MNKLLEQFKKTSGLERNYYKHEYFDGLEELENFARIGSKNYLRTRILWNPKHKNFFKCEFLVGEEYTDCTLFSKGLHIMNIRELRNIEDLISEKLYCEGEYYL